MPYSIDVLLNDFAIRCFRDTADGDYVHARLAFRARLAQQFLWSSLHCLEKYAKGVLLLNRIPCKHVRHEVTPSLKLLRDHGKFEVEFTPAVQNFVEHLESMAPFRYYEASYTFEHLDLVRLDCAVWELRRYCQPLDYSIEVSGEEVGQLEANLCRIRADAAADKKNTSIEAGWLENVIATNDHPSRPGLLWQNLYFGRSRRKRVRLPNVWQGGNAPLWLRPNILDEVLKYVHLPKHVIEAYREFQRQRESERGPAARF